MSEGQEKIKNKKIILISVISIIVVLVIAGLTWCFISKENNEEELFRLNQFYEMLKNKDSYSFTTTLDDNNRMYYMTNNNKAYINTIYEGNESELIIRDGNTYLILDDSKQYYTYNNNEIDLNKIELELEEIKDLEHEEGKEKIENKTYKYEEYKVLTSFAMMDTSEGNEEEAKTRFYFDGDNLAYIKTIIGEKQELLKVDTSYDVNANLFEIPSDYKGM